MSHISGGDPYLLKHIVTRVNPILHQFGHFHNAYGLINRDNVTVHINAAQIEVMKPILVKIPKRSTINNESNIYTSFIN
jgi:Icc-related predicted phosphoesterase